MVCGESHQRKGKQSQGVYPQRGEPPGLAAVRFAGAHPYREGLVDTQRQEGDERTQLLPRICVD